ncbi:hypothetical protein [Bacillus sp. 1P02SD]
MLEVSNKIGWLEGIFEAVHDGILVMCLSNINRGKPYHKEM